MEIAEYQKKFIKDCFEKLKNGETIYPGIWISSLGKYVSRKELKEMTDEIKSTVEKSKQKFTGAVLVDDIHK